MTRHAESSEFLAAAKTEAARAVEHRKKVLEHVGAEAFTVDDFHKQEPGDWKHTTGRSDVTPAELQLGKRCHGAHVETLSADVTPAGSHYLLIHFDVPLIDPSAYRLKIHGLVDKEVSLSLADIKRRKTQTASVLMACAGNGRMGLTERFTSHVPWGPDAFGWCVFTCFASRTPPSLASPHPPYTHVTLHLAPIPHTSPPPISADWTGCSLAELLREVGVKDGAAQVIFTGADKGVEWNTVDYFRRSLTVKQAMTGHVMLCWQMNGADVAAPSP